MPIDPQTKWYSSNDKIPGRIVSAAAALAALGAIATLWVVYDAWTCKRVIPLYITIGVWAVVPPLWFWLEYFYVYRVFGQPDTLELFKYGQDVARAIWAGVLAGLIAFAASGATNQPTQPMDSGRAYTFGWPGKTTAEHCKVLEAPRGNWVKIRIPRGSQGRPLVAWINISEYEVIVPE